MPIVAKWSEPVRVIASAVRARRGDLAATDAYSLCAKLFEAVGVCRAK